MSSWDSIRQNTDSSQRLSDAGVETPTIRIKKEKDENEYEKGYFRIAI